MATYCTVTEKKDSKDIAYRFEGDMADFMSLEAQEVYDLDEDFGEFLYIWGFTPCHVDSKDDVTVTEWRND